MDTLNNMLQFLNLTQRVKNHFTHSLLDVLHMNFVYISQPLSTWLQDPTECTSSGNCFRSITSYFFPKLFT